MQKRFGVCGMIYPSDAVPRTVPKARCPRSQADPSAREEDHTVVARRITGSGGGGSPERRCALVSGRRTRLWSQNRGDFAIAAMIPRFCDHKRSGEAAESGPGSGRFFAPPHTSPVYTEPGLKM